MFATPPPSVCASAWNRHASAALHAQVAAARSAYIDARATVGTDVWSKAGGATSTSRRGCTIVFVFRNGTSLETWGVWKAGSIESWLAPIRNTRRFAFPDNARVHADGTVGFHG
jgi:hypothetical protein